MPRTQGHITSHAPAVAVELSFAVAAVAVEPSFAAVAARVAAAETAARVAAEKRSDASLIGRSGS